MNRWVDKAQIYTAAATKVLGNQPPNKHHVILALSVAEHETRCGDSLNGNWGGTTKRGLSTTEVAALHAANLDPSNKDDIPRAQQILGVQADMVLSHDYSSQAGWYWVWFYKPSNPVDGALYFVKVLCAQRPQCLSILNDLYGTVDQLSRAMYSSHYFYGFYNPHDVVSYNGQELPGDEANIQSYRDALNRHETIIIDSLAGWTPSMFVPAVQLSTDPPFDLIDVQGYQAALTWLSKKMNRPEFDPKGIDGDFGKDTKAAVTNFQNYAALDPTGLMTDITRAALAQVVDMLVKP